MLGHFDLIVIGSGPAGQKGAVNAAKLGKRVALIEAQEAPGGVCIHTGTIPSKSIREAVMHLTGYRERSVYGESYAVKHDITMNDLIFRCNHIIRREVDVIRGQMRRNNVDVVQGRASFVDPHTIRVSRYGAHTDITGDCILIATGTEPARPDNVPFTPGRVIDSDELLQLESLPSSITIVGAGVIGVEYACMLQAVGVKVTLIDRRPRLLEMLDSEIVESLQYQVRRAGIRLLLGEDVDEISMNLEGVRAKLVSGKQVTSRVLLYTIGRQGATGKLCLDNAGLTADNRGRLSVNERMQTEVPHILAAGDVIGFPALASTSMEQGRLATSLAFGVERDSHPELFPYGIYTIPEISIVGRDEAALTRDNIPYEVGVARYSEISRGQIIGDQAGILKILFHAEDRSILGVHIIGEGATELIHIGQAVMTLGGTIDYFVNNVFNYPTLAECYKVAALDGINRQGAPCSEAPLPTLFQAAA